MVRRKKIRPLIGMAAVLMGSALVLAACGSSRPAGSAAQGNTIVIASKNFTENEILAQMMADLVQKKTSLHVVTKINMGGTVPVFQAIKSGQVDVYPGYTGTAYMEILKQPKAASEQVMYAYANQQYKKRFGLELLKPFGFNDTYAIAVTSALAQKDHLTTISSLVPYAGQLTAGIDPECQNRPDCYQGLVKVYGLHFKSVNTMDHSLVEEAMANGQIQATDVFTTDGALLKYHLVVLKDDKHFFPAYLAAPIIRVDFAKAHPKVVAILDELAGKISDAQMERMDYEVDISQKTIQEVAHQFLVQQGLL